MTVYRNSRHKKKENQLWSHEDKKRLSILLFLVLSVLALQANFPGKKHISSTRPVESNDGYCLPNDMSHASIHYTEVDQVEGKYIRYAAFLEKLSCSDAETNGSDEKMEPLTVAKWAELLSSDSVDADKNTRMSLELTNLMKNAPYEAFFFETKGVSSKTASKKQFEFVLVNAPSLKSFCQINGPDLNSFAEQLSAPTTTSTIQDNTNNEYGCSFGNLSGDAQLVAPKWDLKLPHTPSPSAYAHLASFLREAPKIQIASIWNMVAKQYVSVITNKQDNEKVVWLSTSGMGVSYLHFRLDERPKYYTFHQFKKEV